METRLFNDILKETDRKGRLKYSQGRIYLGISFFVFFIMNAVLIFYAFSGKELKDESTEILLVVSNNLKWLLSVLLLYVLGSKVTGSVMDRQTGVSNDYNYDQNITVTPLNPYGGGLIINQQPQMTNRNTTSSIGVTSTNDVKTVDNSIDKEFYGSDSGDEIN